MYCVANVDSECLDLVHPSHFQKKFFLNQGNRNSSNSAVASNTLKIVASFSDLMVCSVVQKRKFGAVALPKPFSSPT